MTYFPDLSPYTYWVHPEDGNDELTTVNIGWLDDIHPFPTGDVPAPFLEQLKLYQDYHVNDIFFGGHSCELCHEVRRPGVAYRAGFGEMRVFGRNNRVYAAPQLLDHYIEKHRYRPPDEFIQAVLEGPLPSTEAYRELARAYRWSYQMKYWPKVGE